MIARRVAQEVVESIDRPDEKRRQEKQVVDQIDEAVGRTAPLELLEQVVDGPQDVVGKPHEHEDRGDGDVIGRDVSE